MTTRQQPSLLTRRRGGLYCCLRCALDTIASVPGLYALHDPVVVPFTRLIASLMHRVLVALAVRSWVGADVACQAP